LPRGGPVLDKAGLQLPFQLAFSSVRGRQVSHREFNLTVGKLPPILDDRRVASLWHLIEDFAGFPTGCIDWQLEYLWPPGGGHPDCQIMRTNGHVGPPKRAGILRNTADHEQRTRETKEWPMVPWPLSPLITGWNRFRPASMPRGVPMQG
jgi:hypothetical protein